MTELETQVVKIQLGDNRQASSFVYTLAETLDESSTEIFVITEMPMFNPAAKEECQRIAEAITASLKRSYRKSVKGNVFENALANINEELSKLVTLGKTHWLGKLNAVVAIKHNNVLSISSVGKISALLYREKQFVSIAESSSNNQPLKTFEQFSEGKLKLGDMFILSTPELLNYISIDRIKSLLDKNELPIAAQSMIEFLQDEMGPEVACGTIFALQVEPGTITDEEVDLNNYLGGPQISNAVIPPSKQWIPHKVKEGAKTAALIAKNFSTDLKDKYLKKNFWKNMADKSGQSIGVVQDRLKQTTSKFQPSQFSGYSRQKKFFLISAAILLIALIVNITIAKINSNKNATIASSNEQLTQIEKLLNDSNAALLYGDEPQAQNLFAQASDIFGKLPADLEKQDDISNKLKDLRAQYQDLDKKLNKVTEANVQSLGTLSTSSNLIGLDEYIATETNRSITAYNKGSGQITDNKFKASESITDSIALKNKLAAIYNGKALFMWDPSADIMTGEFSDQVPKEDDFGGMATYATNNKVYVLDKSLGKIISYTTTARAFSNPVVSVTSDDIKNGSSLAIDGNIYVAVSGTILKFNSGAKQDFNPAVSNLSRNTKLYTEVNFKNIYVLDIDNNKIYILNKDGTLNQTLTSDKFSALQDFVVDSSEDVIYLLNGSELLSIEI